ncbi:MAG: hypothetical protein ABI640_12895 [Gammaproteobacteria bacterium]
MSNAKLSALAEATTLAATNEVYVNAGGTSKRAQLATLAQYINGGAGVFPGVPGGATDNLAAWNSFISAYDYAVIPEGEFARTGPSTPKASSR